MLRLRSLALGALVLSALSPLAWSQEELDVLDPAANPRKMLRGWLIAEAQKHFDARRAAVAALKTPEELRQRQEELRQKFIAALGGLPEKTPLNARVVGRQQRDGYRIEKVIYESRPQHHVTATLYLPEGKGPFPGSIMPIGHSTNGKGAEYVQRGAILLAKTGIACLAYDPIGQGERMQLLDAEGKPAIRGSTSEHTLIGVGALLVGRCAAQYRVWDGIRSLDYLASRPEIDPQRLASTGCSGGGTLTSYLMALDERIAVAAPSCYLTSLERLFVTLGPQDAEQNIPGQVAIGLEHADYVTMRAPRPTLILAASRDFFDIEGTWRTMRECKLLYALAGHAERVDLFESNTSHGYPQSQREAMAGWMGRWLLGRDQPVTEPDFEIAKDADLYCTSAGQVLAELKGKSCFDLNAEAAAELALARKQSLAQAKPAELRARAREALALPRVIPVATRAEGATVRRADYWLEKWTFETEPGVLVPALLAQQDATKRPGPLVLYLHGDGKAADATPGGAIERLVKQGKRVLALDVRATGETAPGLPNPKNPSLFGVEYFESFVSMHLARPLLGQRVLDVLSVVAALPKEDLDRLEIVGIGSAGPVALHAAALDERIGRVTIERSLGSWEEVVRTPVNYNQLALAVPGVLRHYDLPDLAQAIAPRPLDIRQPVSARGEPVE